MAVDGAGSVTERRRVRILRGFIAILVLLGLETSLVFRSGLPDPALADRVDATLIAALVVVLAAVHVMRTPARVELAGHLVLGAAMAVIVACLSVIGGIEAPLVHWVGLVPMLAVVFCGRSGAIGWAGVAISAVLGLIAADAVGADLGDAGVFEGERRAVLWMYKLMDAGSWSVMFLAVGLLYERIRLGQTEELARKNDALEREMHQRGLAEEQTRRLAYYDELTGLPNRSAFHQALDRALRGARREGSSLAVMLLDLDGFKAVNDSLGHAVGDQLLVEVARRLEACTRLSDRVVRCEGEVSRLGGDEFTILLQRVHGQRGASLVAERLLTSLRNPFHVGGHEVFITASVGLVLGPEPAASIDDMLRSADLAMYRAKASGKNQYRFFEQSMNEEVQRRNQIASELRSAIDARQFELHYQPIVDARSGAIAGAEALLRWNHPERGRLLPGAFIEVAEDTGMIVPIGAWILDEALGQLAGWLATGVDPGRLSINVAAAQLRGGGLAEQVADAIERLGLPPERIDLEITESAMLADEIEAERCLRALRELGVRIALDDFGTGYSSLSYVKRFPVDTLKVDRSFTRGLDREEDARGIAAAIVAMGRHLGLRTVGEGVERRSEAQWLRDAGCDELQGFLFAPAVPSEDFFALLQAGGFRELLADKDGPEDAEA